MGDALEALRIVAVLASPGDARHLPDGLGAARPRRRASTDQRLPAAAAWGGYPGGLTVTKGESLFPRKTV